jgi:Ice-binding-like
MYKTHIKFIPVIALFAIFAIFTVIMTIGHSAHAAQATVNLGNASPFAILSGTPNITDAGNASVIHGNVGLSPATGAGIGLTCSQVTGTIYSVDATGPLPCRVTNGPLLVTAKNNLTAAYTDAAGRTPLTTVPTELGGTTLVAGVYNSTSTSFGITAGAGALVLNGQNDPSSVFIFEAPFSGTGLSVGSGSTVSLINGAQACNVFWRVDTAAINTTANFTGTVLALNSISVANGATIQGRLLARNGNVTLINDTITNTVCAGNDTVDVIPGLPNTGEMSGQYVLWGAISTLFITAGLLVAYAAYKKRSI